MSWTAITAQANRPRLTRTPQLLAEIRRSPTPWRAFAWLVDQHGAVLEVERVPRETLLDMLRTLVAGLSANATGRAYAQDLLQRVERFADRVPVMVKHDDGETLELELFDPRELAEDAPS